MMTTAGSIVGGCRWWFPSAPVLRLNAECAHDSVKEMNRVVLRLEYVVNLHL